MKNRFSILTIGLFTLYSFASAQDIKLKKEYLLSLSPTGSVFTLKCFNKTDNKAEKEFHLRYCNDKTKGYNKFIYQPNKYYSKFQIKNSIVDAKYNKKDNTFLISSINDFGMVYGIRKNTTIVYNYRVKPLYIDKAKLIVNYVNPNNGEVVKKMEYKNIKFEGLIQTKNFNFKLYVTPGELDKVQDFTIFSSYPISKTKMCIENRVYSSVIEDYNHQSCRSLIEQSDFVKVSLNAKN